MTVRWTNGSAIGEARTESEDISSRGVYFLLPEEVKSGSVVEIALTLLHEITLTELQPLEEGRADQLNLEMANRRLILRSLLESRGVIGGPHGAPHDWHQENYTELQVKETKDSRERRSVVTRDERSSQLHDSA